MSARELFRCHIYMDDDMQLFTQIGLSEDKNYPGSTSADVYSKVDKENYLLLKDAIGGPSDRITKRNRAIFLKSLLQSAMNRIDIYLEENNVVTELSFQDRHEIIDHGNPPEDNSPGEVFRQIQTEMNHLRSKYSPPDAEKSAYQHLIDLCKHAVDLHEIEYQEKHPQKELIINDSPNGDLV